MNILLVCMADYSNVMFNLSEAINRHTDHSARSVIWCKSKFDYPYDIFYYDHTQVYPIRRLVKNADFVLFGHSIQEGKPYNLPFSPEVKKGIWYTGTHYRLHFDELNKQNHKYNTVFAHRDLEDLYTNSIRLNQPYDTLNNYDPPDFKSPVWSFGHSPSSPGGKGTCHYIEAVKGLDRVDPILIENMKYADCIHAKRNLHLFFDQIYPFYVPPNGHYGYGLALAEAGSNGTLLLNKSFYDDTPIYSVNNAGEMIDTVTMLQTYSVSELERLSRVTRQWTVDNHGYESIVNQFFAGVE